MEEFGTAKQIKIGGLVFGLSSDGRRIVYTTKISGLDRCVIGHEGGRYYALLEAQIFDERLIVAIGSTYDAALQNAWRKAHSQISRMYTDIDRVNKALDSIEDAAL